MGAGRGENVFLSPEVVNPGRPSWVGMGTPPLMLSLSAGSMAMATKQPLRTYGQSIYCGQGFSSVASACCRVTLLWASAISSSKSSSLPYQQATEPLRPLWDGGRPPVCFLRHQQGLNEQ